jgi:hypothetical protein
MFFGLLIGSMMLYCSRDYGIYAFSFLIFWIVRFFLIIITAIINKLLMFIWIILSDYGFPAIAILFGLYYQTEIWFIAATLFVLLNILQYLAMTFLKLRESESSGLAEIYSGFLPGLIIPFSSIFYLFDIGILDSATLQSFYSTFIQGFFALLGIVAMFGVFILDRIRVDKDYFSKLFIGLIILYIISILILTLGLITLPRNSETDCLDLSYNALMPDTPLKERQLPPDSGQILEEIIFTATLGLLICSLAYLYKLVSDILGMSEILDYKG